MASNGITIIRTLITTIRTLITIIRTLITIIRPSPYSEHAIRVTTALPISGSARDLPPLRVRTD
jgi:hypothetical protein